MYAAPGPLISAAHHGRNLSTSHLQLYRLNRLLSQVEHYRLTPKAKQRTRDSGQQSSPIQRTATTRPHSHTNGHTKMTRAKFPNPYTDIHPMPSEASGSKSFGPSPTPNIFSTSNLSSTRGAASEADSGGHVSVLYPASSPFGFSHGGMGGRVFEG